MNTIKPIASSLALVGAVICVVTSSYAQDNSAKTLFSCQTKNHKMIQVSQYPDSLKYTFGSAHKPEMVIKKDFNQVIKQPWNGVGYSYNYSVGFKNGNTTYSVYGAYEREVDGEYSAGVLVNFNNKDISIECDTNAEIIDNIDEFVNSH